MVYATRRTPLSIDGMIEFWLKRFSRVWPVYAIITAVYIPIMILLGWHVGHVDIKTDAWSIFASFAMIPFNFAQPGPWFGGAVLHVGWTINYEMYFYVLFGLSIAFGKFRWAAFSALIAMSLLGLPVMVSVPSANAYIAYGLPGYLNLVTSPLLWEFVIGVVIGKIYLSEFTIPKTPSILLVMASSAFVIWFLLKGVSLKFGITGWGLPYAGLLFSLSMATKTVTIKFPRLLVWLGNISFSLYLVHPLIIHPVYQLLWDRII